MSQSNEIQNIPVVAMRGVVIFPKMVMHFDVARTASMNAIYAAAESDRKVFLVAQKDVFVEDHKIVATEAEVSDKTHAEL